MCSTRAVGASYRVRKLCACLAACRTRLAPVGTRVASTGGRHPPECGRVELFCVYPQANIGGAAAT